MPDNPNKRKVPVGKVPKRTAEQRAARLTVTTSDIEKAQQRIAALKEPGTYFVKGQMKKLNGKAARRLWEAEAES